MTTLKKGGPSRPGSSRATSVIGDIRRKREKPYKIETTKEMKKKRKLMMNTSYQAAPPGYTFLPVGTQDLAERCKELSRQRNLSVNVVNAKPLSKHATDPEKISHHIHRIGYHFNSELVDQAREELGYVIHRGHFIKEADLQAQNQKSYIAAVMARNGYFIDQTNQTESPEHVRAAIKELFPKMPNEDLDMIVTHAWKKGSRRVGTNSTLDLPRRVQLATIARIRHRYTDYDQLLRAFEWKQARAEVEPVCLQKLIEWRGENDTQDEHELEEIVRETIVIDDEDDDDDVGHGSEADDEDSDAELDESDASVEFIHQLAVDHDLRPESANEATRGFLRQPPAWRPRPQRTQQQTEIAREKIGAARRLIRNAPPPQALYADSSRSTQNHYAEDRNLATIHMPNHEGQPPADTVFMDGRLYYREPAQPPIHPTVPHSQYSNRHHPPAEAHHRVQPYPPQAQLSPFASLQPSGSNSVERVLPSIEPHGPAPIPQRERYPALHHALPQDSERIHIEKRPRLDPPSSHTAHPRPPGDGFRPVYPQSTLTHSIRTPPRPTEVIDLTTPERRGRSGTPSPMRDVVPTLPRHTQHNYNNQKQRAFDYGGLPNRPPVAQDTGLRAPSAQQHQLLTEPYDPRQPMLSLRDQEQLRNAPLVRQEPHLGASSTRPRIASDLYEASPQYKQVYIPPPDHQVDDGIAYGHVAYQEPLGRYVAAHTLTPQPVHGAPAPVQQMPLDGRR